MFTGLTGLVLMNAVVDSSSLLEELPTLPQIAAAGAGGGSMPRNTMVMLHMGWPAAPRSLQA